MNKPNLAAYISTFYVIAEPDVFNELRTAGISEKQLIAAEKFLSTTTGMEYLSGESLIEEYIDQYNFDKPLHLITYIGDRYGDGEVYGPLKHTGNFI